MENRKNKDVEDILDYIKSKWQVSVFEEDVLESVFYLFLRQKIEEIKKIEHLVNGETEELLKLLNNREVIEYAIEEFDLVRNKVWDLESALDDLDFDWINKVDIDDMIDYIETKGFEIVETESNYDIVTQSDLEEMTELFLKADINKRGEIINNLKKK